MNDELNLQNLHGQVIVITGASSGIGQAVARDLAAAGMRVVATARRADRLDALAAELGDALVTLPGDITDPALPDRLIALAMARFGRCDVVFNNAGIMESRPLDQLDIEGVAQMVRVNVEAAFRVAYAAVMHFRRQGHGTLLCTSSVVGRKVPRPYAGWYAATKHAVEALCESLRMELAGTGIRICALEPGIVQTEFFTRLPQIPEHVRQLEHPLQPEDVARVVRFVLRQPPHVTMPQIMVLPQGQSI